MQASEPRKSRRLWVSPAWPTPCTPRLPPLLFLLNTQGTIRGPLLFVILKASPGTCCKVGLCWRSLSEQSLLPLWSHFSRLRWLSTWPPSACLLLRPGPCHSFQGNVNKRTFPSAHLQGQAWSRCSVNEHWVAVARVSSLWICGSALATNLFCPLSSWAAVKFPRPIELPAIFLPSLVQRQFGPQPLPTPPGLGRPGLVWNRAHG